MKSIITGNIKSDMSFEREYILYFIPAVILYAWLFFRFGFHRNREQVTASAQSLNSGKTWRDRLTDLIPVFRFIGFIFLLIALAGPGQKAELLPDEQNGVDIMLALDVSGSMTVTPDFAPSNRLEVSKNLMKEFVKKRTTDRMGLVVFAGAAYLQSPLTSDQSSLQEIISDVHPGSVAEQGTAVGDAVILCTYRLKKSKAKSRIIVLLTDGASNAGKVDILTSSEASKEFGIRIYSIGIGTDRSAETDFESLEKISEKTSGKFYRAHDPAELETVFSDIDTLEKDILNSRPKTILRTQFELFLYIALICFCLDLILRTFLGRSYV